MRWMTRDWIREAGGINGYGYANANPLNGTDRMGTAVGPALYFGYIAASALVAYTTSIWAQIASNGGDPLAVNQAQAGQWAITGAEMMAGGLLMTPISTAVRIGESGGVCVPDFIASPNGSIIRIPQGAEGPFPVMNGKGVMYTGGSGGFGLPKNISSVRIMDPKFGFQNGYVNYGSTQANGGWQSLSPITGKSVSPNDQWWHIPL
jgi:hypothetical protein